MYIKCVYIYVSVLAMHTSAYNCMIMSSMICQMLSHILQLHIWCILKAAHRRCFMDLLMNMQVSRGGLAVYSIDEAQGQYMRKKQHLEFQYT